MQSVQHTGCLEDDNDTDSVEGAECDPLVNRTLDNGTNHNGQDDKEEKRLADLQQVAEDLVETVEEDNVEIPVHDRVPSHAEGTMMTPQIVSLAGNESTTPSQNEVIAEKFKLKTTLVKNVAKLLSDT